MAEPLASASTELARALLVRCKARDPAAFREFVVRYERPVFALLSRLLGHGPHVDDLAQEAFLRAFRAFPTFDVDAAAKPSTWLLTIATRLALDHRKRAALATVSIEAADTAPAGTTPETEYRRREMGSRIARAASELPDDQRVAFVLAEFHGLSITEIAGMVGIPEATVRTRLFRAREKLKTALQELS
ncbi:MAG TPA: sigma-70 family RNA polymerase sigma factor [Kofleriaceae bacterium]|nr:sigma-70 family RNA polymerase sigma factor [Kofleriaceae bacterium]